MNSLGLLQYWNHRGQCPDLDLEVVWFVSNRFASAQPLSRLISDQPSWLESTNTMNLSLYSVNAFLILDTEGHRVLAKYYRPKSHPRGEPKGLLTLKEQRAFEKGLWQKTKKPGGGWLSQAMSILESMYL